MSFLGGEGDVYRHVRSSAQGVDLTLSCSVRQWQAVYALMCPATEPPPSLSGYVYTFSNQQMITLPLVQPLLYSA